jgi:hypothetical protein
MELFNQEKDVRVFCKLVPTFPNGIKEVFDALSKEVNGPAGRDFYGISYLDDHGKIVYKAAASALENEGPSKHGEPFTIKKGIYLGEMLHGWMSKTSQIKDVFMKLMEDPRMDRTYPCIELYKSDQEMICMVRIK